MRDVVDKNKTKQTNKQQQQQQRRRRRQQQNTPKQTNQLISALYKLKTLGNNITFLFLLK